MLPFNVSTPVLYYNRDAFRAAGLDPNAPPTTWKDWLAAAKALTIRDGSGTVTQWGMTTPPQWGRWAMTNQAGGGWIDPADNAVQLDSPESIRAYQFAADLVNVHKVVSIEAALDEDVASEYFMSGRAAMEVNSTGGLTRKLANAPFELGVAALPCDATCAAPIGGATLGIVAMAPQEVRDGAWAFIEFATTVENNAFIFARTGYLPIINGAIEHELAREKIAANPAYLVANTQLDIAFARARPPAMPAIRAEEPAVWQSIVLGEQTAEKALTDFAQTMRELIAKN